MSPSGLPVALTEGGGVGDPDGAGGAAGGRGGGVVPDPLVLPPVVNPPDVLPPVLQPVEPEPVPGVGAERLALPRETFSRTPVPVRTTPDFAALMTRPW